MFVKDSHALLDKELTSIKKNLLDAKPFPKHNVIPIGSIHIQVNLSDIRTRVTGEQAKFLKKSMEYR